MLLRRIVVQNARSFLEEQTLLTEGSISILIGPNGGGKTNLLDAVIFFLRRHLFSSRFAVHVPTAENPDRYEFRHNDAINQLILEPHSQGAGISQILKIDLEVTTTDINNITSIKADARRFFDIFNDKYKNIEDLLVADEWDLTQVSAGTIVTYTLDNGQLLYRNPAATIALAYMRLFEVDGLLRSELKLASLETPLMYLSVSRAVNAFNSSVQLAGYNDYEQKRHSDACYSRSNSSFVPLAIGRLAQKYRLLLEEDKGIALQSFRSDEGIRNLTYMLQKLGYDWELITVSPLRNDYNIQLSKQGSKFMMSSASSGERELITYLFAIFSLNVRNALIIIDEPELHLHPKWQRILLDLFEQLSTLTNNQFIMATHSPIFVSPASIQYVSRVYSRNQRSNITRLDTSALPGAKHLLSLVNSLNNERIFFADAVLLVEGISDRLLFEAIANKYIHENRINGILEIVSVGGKNLFTAYQKLLSAAQIQHYVVADLDYIEQIGDDKIKQLFAINSNEIKRDVLENVKSVDGATLVAAIDRAMQNESWQDAAALWDYIKMRRQRLRPDLDATQEKMLDDFLNHKREQGVFILKDGTIEDYLPSGFKSKKYLETC